MQGTLIPAAAVSTGVVVLVVGFVLWRRSQRNAALEAARGGGPRLAAPVLQHHAPPAPSPSYRGGGGYGYGGGGGAPRRQSAAPAARSRHEREMVDYDDLL